MYQVKVSDNDDPSSAIISSTLDTTMDISNLEPCSNYTMGVSSFNMFQVPGEASTVTHATASEYLRDTDFNGWKTDKYCVLGKV